MARTNFQYEKRQRELEKKRKQEEKVRRKQEAKGDSATTQEYGNAQFGAAVEEAGSNEPVAQLIPGGDPKDL